MKFKIASILGLIFPLSAALMLSAFLGCGGGAYGNGTQAYDGTWNLNLKGYTKPSPVTPDTAMDCWEGLTVIEIAHGQGTVAELVHCQGNVSLNEALYGYPKFLSVGVTLTPTGSGVEGTVHATALGGTIDETGICIDRVTCQAKDLTMFKCGTAAAAYPTPGC